ncbi:hypothetical protein FACS1894110_00520 [Spirochaetia bacterium]|nr:hypothetical protein FACS1894110_00520 [Spirochaetia bacterium]
MEYIQLTHTDLRVSRMSIGTAHYGGMVPVEDCKAQLDYYFDHGGNTINTAHSFCDWLPGPKSQSELIIGQWIKERGTRDKIILGTMGAHPLFDGKDLPRVSPDAVKEDLDGSLRALQTNYIDLYFLQRDDIHRSVEELIDCLDEQVKAGKIRWYGCSNWTLARIRAARAYADKKGSPGFICNQLMWALADIRAEQVSNKNWVLMDGETYGYHTQTQLSAMAFTGLSKGYFIRRSRGTAIPPKIEATYQCPENDRIFAKAEAFSRETGLSVADLAYLYFNVQPFPAVSVTSFSSQGQLIEAMRHSEGVKTDLAFLKEFDEIKKYRV